MTRATPQGGRARHRRAFRRAERETRVRALARGDFFGWHEAFAGYLNSRGRQLDASHALRVWQWFESEPPRLEALVAVSGDRIAGFVHFHEVPVPASGRVDLVIDDLHAVPGAYPDDATEQLLEALHGLARERGAAQLCRLVPADDVSTLRDWDRLSARQDVVAYRLSISEVS